MVIQPIAIKEVAELPVGQYVVKVIGDGLDIAPIQVLVTK